jgi:hypothetical protein
MPVPMHGIQATVKKEMVDGAAFFILAFVFFLLSGRQRMVVKSADAFPVVAINCYHQAPCAKPNQVCGLGCATFC